MNDLLGYRRIDYSPILRTVKERPSRTEKWVGPIEHRPGVKRDLARRKDQAAPSPFPPTPGPNAGTNADAADKNVCATMQKHVFGGTKPNIDFAFWIQ
ncbi:MAG: hypothetical protein ACLQBJ_17905 [Bryobacteraceae bacterium]